MDRPFQKINKLIGGALARRAVFPLTAAPILTAFKCIVSMDPIPVKANSAKGRTKIKLASLIIISCSKEIDKLRYKRKCYILECFPRDILNFSDMARYCGVSRQTITDIINSNKMPSVSLALDIVDYINKNINLPFHYCVDELWK